MVQELSEAVKAVKDMDKKLVVAENRLAYVEAECKRLAIARDAMQAEIDKKTSDYTIYVAQRDQESKKIRQDTLDGQNQLIKDKEEFQGILKQFQKERQSFLAEKQHGDAQALQVKAKMEGIQNFIIAVQRAISVLGL